MKLVKSFSIPALFLLLGIGISFYPVLSSSFRQFLSDPVDPRLNNLILEHIWNWLQGRVSTTQFLDVPFYYPAAGVGAWTDTLWGSAPFYLILRALGLSMTDAFSGWVMLMCALNFICAYFSLRKSFGFKMVGASIGAYLFAFGSPRLMQIGHGQLYPAFATPLFFGWLYEGFKNLPKIDKDKIILAALALIYQIYAGFYLGWFLVLATVLGGLYLLCRSRTRPAFITALKENLIFFSCLGGASFFLLLPQLLPYLEAAKLFGKRPYSGVRATFPRFISYFNVGPRSYFEGWIHHFIGADKLPMAHEHGMGVGIITSIAILLGFYRGRNERFDLRSAGVLALILFCVSISFFTVSLWGLIYLFFPGGSAIRAVGRLSLTLLFLYAIPLAYYTDKIRAPLRWGLCLLVILEQAYAVPTFTLATVQNRVNQITRSVPSPCEVFYIMGQENGISIDETQMDVMYSAYFSGRKTLNGYYGHDPISWFLSPGTDKNLEMWEETNNFKLTHSCITHFN